MLHAAQTVPAAEQSAWSRRATVQTNHSSRIAEAINPELVFQMHSMCGPGESVAELMFILFTRTCMHNRHCGSGAAEDVVQRRAIMLSFLGNFQHG